MKKAQGKIRKKRHDQIRKNEERKNPQNHMLLIHIFASNKHNIFSFNKYKVVSRDRHPAPSFLASMLSLPPPLLSSFHLSTHSLFEGHIPNAEAQIFQRPKLKCHFVS